MTASTVGAGRRRGLGGRCFLRERGECQSEGYVPTWRVAILSIVSFLDHVGNVELLVQ